jgi:hypothetical protein
MGGRAAVSRKKGFAECEAFLIKLYYSSTPVGGLVTTESTVPLLPLPLSAQRLMRLLPIS